MSGHSVLHPAHQLQNIVKSEESRDGDPCVFVSMVPGVHRDEPACDGSQLVSRTGQRTEGKTKSLEYFIKPIVLSDQSYFSVFTRR